MKRFIWPLDDKERTQLSYNRNEIGYKFIWQAKLFCQTRKNAIIFFFGKIYCKLFGHKKPFGTRKQIDVVLIPQKSIVTTLISPILAKEICPRCFKIIK